MSEQETLINLNKCLLESIAEGNWKAYAGLCDPSLRTCFEPEAHGNLVEGMEFHHFYFGLERPANTKRINTTLANPHVRLLGDTAIVCYIRLVQYVDAAGIPQTKAIEETRVWHKRDGVWLHVHFHRSLPTG